MNVLILFCCAFSLQAHPERSGFGNDRCRVGDMCCCYTSLNLKTSYPVSTWRDVSDNDNQCSGVVQSESCWMCSALVFDEAGRVGSVCEVELCWLGADMLRTFFSGVLWHDGEGWDTHSRAPNQHRLNAWKFLRVWITLLIWHLRWHLCFGYYSNIVFDLYGLCRILAAICSCYLFLVFL